MSFTGLNIMNFLKRFFQGCLMFLGIIIGMSVIVYISTKLSMFLLNYFFGSAPFIYGFPLSMLIFCVLLGGVLYATDPQHKRSL